MLMLLIAPLTFLVISFAYAESPNPPRAGRIEGRFTYSYYSTEDNFSSAPLITNGSFSHMAGEFAATYDWQPDWRFTAGLNGAWVETSDGIITRSNSGVNEIFVNAQKWYESGPFDIAPEGTFVFPLIRPDENADDALIGEGAMRLRAGAWGFWPLGTYKPFAYLGFEYRDGGRAFLLPYEAGIKFKFPALWLQGSVRGFQTIVDDADSDNQLNREAYLKRVNGGSLRFYSVNPSGTDLSAEAGTQFGSWSVFGGFAITVLGDNFAEGWTGYGGLAWTPVISPKKVDDGFNIRKERYDEGLFREENGEKQFIEDPDYQEPAQRRNEVPDDPTVPPPPPPEAKPSRPVEMQLELRRVPKKKKKPVRKKNQNLDNMMKDAESALENAQ